MEDVRRAKVKTIAMALLAACLFLFPSRASPDFGGFAGDSDYGGDGGGSSWSSGSDWGSSTRSYEGTTGYIDDELGFSASEIVVAVVVLFILMQASSSSRKRGKTRGPEVATPSRGDISPMGEYSRVDPRFDEARLKEQIASLYVQMQDRWGEKDIGPLRPWLTSLFYEQMERQLDGLRRARRTDHTERIAVLGVELLGWRQGGGMDEIVARVETRIVTYITDDRTGRVVSGHRDKEKFMTYEWSLVRRTGALTEDVGGVQGTSCPQCGAPLSINASAQCSYCGNVITAANDAWAVSAIKGISQRTA
ncbi:MAG: zinc-ribbon domain-containing transport protein [Synergistaceae bacterium]|nr:zinc-ribbon domain-containing transport protein [Synergistaceae bacterium]